MNKFDNGNRCYSSTTGSKNRLVSGKDFKLFKQIEEKEKQKVEEVKKAWHQKIRNRVGAEIGLKINDKSIDEENANAQKLEENNEGYGINGKKVKDKPKQIKIIIEISDEVPSCFCDENILEDKEGNMIPIGILNNLKNIRDSEKALEALIADFDYVAKKIDVDSSEKEQAIKTNENIKKLLEVLEEDKKNQKDPFGEKLKEQNQDYLGAYFYQRTQPTIKIFWRAIVGLASIFKISVEDLTIITLIHELSHVYTHLGIDTDGNMWGEFGEADLNVVEGVAQFYTEVVCKKLGDEKASLSKSFNKLLKFQGEAYVVHKDWFKKEKGRRFQEVVRFALIDIRRNGKLSYDDFVESIEETTKRLAKQ